MNGTDSIRGSARALPRLLLIALAIALPTGALRAQFTEATPAELLGPTSSAGVAWGDQDGDGDLDLYIANANGANSLLRNDGPDGFVDIAVGELTLIPGMSSACAWADVDGDGDLDLYFVQEQSSNKLLRNDGGDSFSLVPGAANDPGAGSTFSWADFDLDGRVDLYVGNAQEANILYRNVDGTVFSDVTAPPLGDAGFATGVAWGDYDDDGDQDLYVTNNDGPNRLLRNDAGTFVDVTTPALLGAGPTVSATWVDFDDDLDLDLSIVGFFIPNQLLRNDGNGVFVDVAPGTPLADPGSGFTAQWADIDNDGDQDVHILNHLTPNVTLRNDGVAGFVPVTGVEAAPLAQAVDIVWADVDQDGDLDLYLSNGGGANAYFRNDQATGNHWLHLGLVGTVSNRTAIGAKVVVTAGGASRLRVVEGTNGYLSQNSLDLEFGLGGATVADSVEIRWPSGLVQTLGPVAADQRIEVVEPVTFIRGDANADGSLDIADPIAMLDRLFVAGAPGACEAAFDANDDETVNIADPIFTLGTLFSGGPDPAPPHPDCGVDPTPGGPTCTAFPACP